MEFRWRRGDLRILAVAAGQRLPYLPTPDLRRAGLPGFRGVDLFALFAPRGTPRISSSSSTPMCATCGGRRLAPPTGGNFVDPADTAAQFAAEVKRMPPNRERIGAASGAGSLASMKSDRDPPLGRPRWMLRGRARAGAPRAGEVRIRILPPTVNRVSMSGCGPGKPVQLGITLPLIPGVDSPV